MELTCRVQLGTSQEDILAELKNSQLIVKGSQVVVPPTGIHYRPAPGGRLVRELDVEAARPVDVVTLRTELGQIARSLEDKAKAIQKVYFLYDRLCAEEYFEVDEKLRKSEFDQRPPGGIQYYQWLRKFYFPRGVVHPPK